MTEIAEKNEVTEQPEKQLLVALDSLKALSNSVAMLINILAAMQASGQYRLNVTDINEAAAYLNRAVNQIQALSTILTGDEPEIRRVIT